MKDFKYAVLCLIAFAFFSCAEETEERNNEPTFVDTEIIEVSEEVKIEIAQDVERDSIQKELSIQSYFLDLGCCDDEAKRTEICCCNAVLEEYRSLVESDDSKLGEYNMSDPILGNCKKLMAKEFDLVDNPIIEEEEDEYGGGF